MKNANHSSFLILVALLASTMNVLGQANSPSAIRGRLIDTNGDPLRFANVVVVTQNTGTTTNESGEFLIDTSQLTTADTISFRYIGFEVKNLALAEVDSIVVLSEQIFNLSEVFVFGDDYDAKEIIEKVEDNIEKNYVSASSEKLQVFARHRYTQDMTMDLDFKKSTFEELSESYINSLKDKIPEHMTWYTDFLGDHYVKKGPQPYSDFKISPTRIVSLKGKQRNALKEMEGVFGKLLDGTKEDEYWKAKTGIISQKVTIQDDRPKDDTSGVDRKNQRNMAYYNRMMTYEYRYAKLQDDDNWEFLYKTGRYEYKLAGGTRVNGEDVYIIDFTPKKKGLFIGRVFISMTTFALVRADYEYDKGKVGTDFSLLGVGYKENYFGGSIFFEKQEAGYVLKSFSVKSTNTTRVDRKFSLLKKRKRFLWDKTVKEAKCGIDVKVHDTAETQFVVLSRTAISEAKQTAAIQPDYGDVIYVDKFDDSLWEGYNIIQPTKAMRDYSQPLKEHEQ